MSIVQHVLNIDDELCQCDSKNQYDCAIKLQHLLNKNSELIFSEDQYFLNTHGHRLYTNLLSFKCKWPLYGKRVLIIAIMINDLIYDIIDKFVNDDYNVTVACKIVNVPLKDKFRTFPLSNPFYIDFNYDTIIECDPYFYLRYDPLVKDNQIESSKFKFDIVIGLDYMESEKLKLFKSKSFVLLCDVTLEQFIENNNDKLDLKVIHTSYSSSIENINYEIVKLDNSMNIYNYIINESQP